jgi:copper(I)-binding protein
VTSADRVPGRTVASAALLLLGLAAACGDGDDPNDGAPTETVVDGMAVRGAWARPTAPGIGETAIYLEVENLGAPDDRILGATATRCATIVPHQTTIDDDGVASMPGILGDELHLPAGRTVAFEPLGLHLMCLGLGDTLEQGDVFELTLRFDAHEPMTVPVIVDQR